MLDAKASGLNQIKYLAFVLGVCALAVMGCSKSLPAHVVRGADGNAYPQAGYTFIDQSKSLDVKWTPGVAYPGYPHVTASDQEGIWNHDAGYTWVSTNADGDFRVVWTEGQSYPNCPHVTSAAQEGEWQHEAGYQWVTSTPGDFRVVWTAGLSDRDNPHITSSSQEGHWHPDAGYTWVNSTTGDLRVQWTPGQSDSDHPHILSAQEEGYWDAEPGYSFNNANDAFGGVVWNPGATHPLFPHIHAADEESYWNADSGYRFVSQDSLQVEEVGDGDSSYSDQKIDSALIKGLGALIANAIAQPSENDTANDRFGEAVAGQVRDNLIDSAASDVRDAINNSPSQ
jgi:hypothetical protein